MRRNPGPFERLFRTDNPLLLLAAIGLALFALAAFPLLDLLGVGWWVPDGD